MHINLCNRNVWGELQKREMELLHRSNVMVMAQYTVENAQTPLLINNMCVLENGYTAVCFIEYGKWYITDKIFDFQANPTGFMVKLVTPVTENLTFLTAMDLFVRVWITPENEFHISGTKMLKKVLEEGFLSETVEQGVISTMDELIPSIQAGTFPPPFVKDFRIEKKA